MRRSLPLPRSISLSAPAAAIAAGLLACSCGRPSTAAGDEGPPLPVVEYVTKQEILTALPLRVQLPARYGAERVLVFVHLWGSPDWTALELARAGQTWSGEVSCRAVSTVTGNTKYFFLALDAEGRTVVGSGSPEWPHVATIVGALPEGPQGLPGSFAPVRCHDPADCPPDFPGCPAYAFVRPSCRSDGDCPASGRCAWDHYCDPVPDADVAVFAEMSEEDRLAATVRAVTRRYQTAAASGRLSR